MATNNESSTGNATDELNPNESNSTEDLDSTDRISTTDDPIEIENLLKTLSEDPLFPAWGKSLIHVIQSKCNKLTADVDRVENDNIKLQEEIQDLYDEKDEILDSIYNLESDLYKLAQYGRRENLQIQGVKNNIKQNDLEAYVIQTLDKIGVKVKSFDIAGCHRLYQKDKSKPPDVIVRFVNRKIVIKCRKNQYRLRELNGLKHLRFLDNLCPYYKKILAECGKLRREYKIAKYWTFNGTIYVKKYEEEEKGVKIFHIDELIGLAEGDDAANEQVIHNNNNSNNNKDKKRSNIEIKV